MKLPKAVTSALAITVVAVPLFLLSPSAQAAPTLADVQARVQVLQEDAAAAAEGAQSAKVQLDQLNRTLNGIKQQAAVQGQTVNLLRKSLGAIAIEQ